ncbi:MAG: glycosyltransferase [Acidobacteria bacterium]|nr:glycosyltransferase [Acidobacteriota bacterium]
MKSLYVAGYPSFYGGADTELDHNIDLWRQMGVDVHLVPMFGADDAMKKLCDARGCHTHEYEPGIFKDQIVASWCNGGFLEQLPLIMEHGKPEMVIWFNCMCWTFEKELVAHQNGWIDQFGFVSRYQQSMLTPALEAIRPVQAFEGYRPYFNPDSGSQRLTFSYHPPTDWFAMGRVSRDDGAKYSSDMWRIFDKVCAPVPTKTFVLGYGPNAHWKTGSAPPGLDWQTWLPAGIPVRELYERLHVLIHKTGGSRESYCRIIPEAYACGIPVIVEDDYAFPDLVIDGVTGFRCQSSDEMSFRASELAFDEPRRKKMAHAGREFLIGQLAGRDECWQAWQRVLA